MSQVADGEGLMITAGDGEAMESAPASKRIEMSKIIPANLPGQHGRDTLAKGCDKEAQMLGDIHSQSKVEENAYHSGTLESMLNPKMKKAIVTLLMEMSKHMNGGDPPAGEIVTTQALKKINPEMVVLRIKHLRNLGVKLQPRREGFIVEYFHRVQDFVAELEVSSLDVVLCRETDLLFLQQLLLHITATSEGTEGPLPSPPKSSPTGNFVVEALPAPPPCHRRANAEPLHVPTLDDIS